MPQLGARALLALCKELRNRFTARGWATEHVFGGLPLRKGYGNMVMPLAITVLARET